MRAIKKSCKFLGTSHNGKYKYYLKNDNYVYIENKFGREIGYYCSYVSWLRTMHKILKYGVEND